jgi:hypothetical protein
MEYLLEIYDPEIKTLKTFRAAVPFQAIRVGDLLNTKQWGTGIQWPLLRILNVEHVLDEKTSAGIDPAGTITHLLRLYTESVPDTAETRRKST